MRIEKLLNFTVRRLFLTFDRAVSENVDTDFLKRKRK